MFISLFGFSLWIVIVFCAVILETITTHKIKILWLIGIAVFVWLSATRGQNVPDTVAYIEAYQNLQINLSNIYMGGFEVGFALFSMLCKVAFGNNTVFYFAFITAINIFIVYKVIKAYRINSNIAVLLYISFYGFYFNFIVIRVGLAASLILLSWSMFDKNKLKSVTLFIIATLFHSSVAIAAIAYIFLYKELKFSKVIYCCWLAVIGMLYLAKIDFSIYQAIFSFIANQIPVLNRYNYYLIDPLYLDGISVRFILNYMLALAFIMLKENQEDNYDKLLNIYMMGLSILACFSSFMFIERVTDIFVITNFLLAYKAYLKINDRFFRLLLYIATIAPNIFFVMRIINKN